MKSTLKTLLAGALTLSAVHCVDPAINERGVMVPAQEKEADKDTKKKDDPAMKLVL